MFILETNPKFVRLFVFGCNWCVYSPTVTDELLLQGHPDTQLKWVRLTHWKNGLFYDNVIQYKFPYLYLGDMKRETWTF